MDISVLDPAEGALRVPRKIFLTNNLRLVKKIFTSGKLIAHMKKHENPKTLYLIVYLPYCGIL